MVYHCLLERVEIPENRRAEDVLRDVDNRLGVHDWATPGGRVKQRAAPEGPSWWYGDEDASQSFLASMGVDLSG